MLEKTNEKYMARRRDMEDWFCHCGFRENLVSCYLLHPRPYLSPQTLSSPTGGGVLMLQGVTLRGKFCVLKPCEFPHLLFQVVQGEV